MFIHGPPGYTTNFLDSAGGGKGFFSKEEDFQVSCRNTGRGYDYYEPRIAGMAEIDYRLPRITRTSTDLLIGGSFCFYPIVLKSYEQ